LGFDKVAKGWVPGMTRESQLQQVYPEDVFRHLVAVERTRSERSGRTFALLLVDLRPDARGSSALLYPLVARRIFAGLEQCLRETDYMGWYRAEAVVGAVLTELPDGPDVVAPNSVAARANHVLSQNLPSRVANRIRLRLHLHGALQAASAYHHTRGQG
jgi:hypothetical protein